MGGYFGEKKEIKDLLGQVEEGSEKEKFLSQILQTFRGDYVVIHGIAVLVRVERLRGNKRRLTSLGVLQEELLEKMADSLLSISEVGGLIAAKSLRTFLERHAVRTEEIIKRIEEEHGQIEPISRWALRCRLDDCRF